MYRPLNELCKLARQSPYNKATNEQIISWTSENLPIETLTHRCLLAGASYTGKCYRQWQAKIDEGDFLSLVYLAHGQALDSWDRKHHYIAWFGQYLLNQCNIHYRAKRSVVWVPMHVRDKDILDATISFDPDAGKSFGGEEGERSFWESMGDDEPIFDGSIIEELKEVAPDLYSIYIDGYSNSDLMGKHKRSHQVISKKIKAQKEAARKLFNK